MTITSASSVYDHTRLQMPLEERLAEGVPLSGYSFESLRRELVSRKYSSRTLKAYLYYNRELLTFCSKPPADITVNDLKNFLLHTVECKKVSVSTLNSVISALKFFYGTMLGRDFSCEIKRPRKDKKLPNVLSDKEVERICN